MKRFVLFFLLVALVGSACRFKPKDGVSWDTNMVSPLLKSRVGLADALTDTTLTQINDDNSITVVFRDTIVNLALADYLVVPDTSFAAKVTLDSITLSTDTLTQDITLGQIGRQLQSQGNPAGDAIMNNHGGTVPFLPPNNDLSSDDIDIDASAFFDEAVLLSGWMVVQIDNRLPVDINSVTFHLRNNGVLQDTLVRKTIAPIPVNQTRKDSADLAGKTVESTMAGKLEDIDIAGGFNVPIDTNDYIRMTVIVRDLGASSATAVFPAQTVLDDRSRINYQFDNGIEIKRMRVASGELRINAVSTIQDTIDFTYTLPTAIKNGQQVVVQDRLEPDTVLGVSEANVLFDLTDYYIDMTVNGDSINLFPYHLVGNLLYSGRKNTMDLSDSIDVFYGLFDIKPSYIEGYLGQETFSFVETIDLDFFNSILGGTLDLTRPKVELTMLNSIGVDGELKINQMEAFNSRTGQSVALTGSIISSATELRGPKLPNVGQTVTTKILLDNNNSNVRQFISLLPDRLQFDMEVLINKNGNPALRDNFATDKSRIMAFLDMEVPLEGIANNLILQDTVPLAISEVTLPTGVSEGNLKLIVSNNFPFEADVQVYFFDAGGAIFDSLFTGTDNLVPAGKIDDNGFVNEPGTKTLVTAATQERLDMLRSRGREAVIQFTMSTKPDGQAVKLYTTYGIDFHLIGDFKFTVDI
jgi:hypothetical protein